MKDVIAAIGIVAMIVLAILVVLSQRTNPNLISPTNTSETGIEYTKFTIDGMPCIYVTEGIGQSKTGGPTCDWSKHKD